jgi:hypothetical protein
MSTFKESLYTKAASQLENLIFALEQKQRVQLKSANLVNAGILQDADKQAFTDLFVNSSDDALNRASDALNLVARASSNTGWGKEDVLPDTSYSSDPDNRYARLDAFIMNGVEY